MFVFNTAFVFAFKRLIKRVDCQRSLVILIGIIEGKPTPVIHALLIEEPSCTWLWLATIKTVDHYICSLHGWYSVSNRGFYGTRGFRLPVIGGASFDDGDIQGYKTQMHVLMLLTRCPRPPDNKIWRGGTINLLRTWMSKFENRSLYFTFRLTNY